MEAFKKLAVLISGAFVVFLVVWLLSFTNNATPDVALQQQNNMIPLNDYQPNTQRISPTKENESNFKWREKEAEPTKKEPLDALPLTKVEPEPETPKVVGKIPPFSTNPNKIFVTAANRILPAVVSIESTRKADSGFDLLHPFLNRDGEDEEEFELPSSGSGIVISPDGYIITNNHVVEGSSELKVKLYDKREFPAVIIGGDPTTDIAVVKVDISGLDPAFIGDSDSISIGEWVMAVGNPLNFTSTVTSGIISAIGRDINVIDNSRYRYGIENFIQTDAVINPGNSGGALINLNGEVIGVNTAIATRSGFYQGYGFAIPMNLVKKVSQDLIEYGRVRRAILGVTIQQINDRIAKANGLEKPTGALIQSVAPNSTASKAGIKRGDIILSVNGAEVVSVNDLQIKIAQERPGDVVEIVLWRNKQAYKLDVELMEAPGSAPAVSRNENTKIDTSKNAQPTFINLGLTFTELSDENKETYEVENGVFIEDVARKSPAEIAGIRSGDVIVQIDEVPVFNIAEVLTTIETLESGEYIKFVIKSMAGIEPRIVFVEAP